MNPIREEFKRFRTSGRMSPALYRELHRLAAVVFYGKGISQPEVREDLFGEFLEKRLLKLSPAFYLRIESFTDKQIRSYLAFALKKTALDYFRRQRRPAEVQEGEAQPAYVLSSSDLLELEGDSWQRDLPATLRTEYRLIAGAVYLRIWSSLQLAQQEVFCLLYNAGKNTQEVSQLKGLSLGTVQNYKQRIAEKAAQEAEVREIAELAYQMIALSCCLDGYPHQNEDEKKATGEVAAT